MLEILNSIVNELSSGRDVILCSILASSGSSPRGAGAKMVVFQNGKTIGTIGGGAVEKICTEQAINAFKDKTSFKYSYCLNKNEVNDIGMICGGNVEVYFQYLSATDNINIDIFKELLQYFKNKKDLWLVNIIEDDIVTQCGYFTEETGLKYISTDFSDMALSQIKPTASYHKGTPTIYTEKISTSSTVYIFGGGHVGKALLPVLTTVGFNVVIYDNRKDFANKEFFPTAKEVILGDYPSFAQRVDITEKDYVVIMTPGHQADFEVLDGALKTKATYIGCIGSKNKVAKTVERLKANGHTAENISRVNSPIGLNIGAETPEEIAISIAAQMIMHRANNSAK